MAKTGWKLTDETKRKMSKAKKGKTPPNKGKTMSEEQKQKIFESNKGQKRTDETKRKISESKTGVKQTEEHVRKVSESRTGMKHTEESKQRMSAAQQGIPYENWESFACDKKYCPKFDKNCRESNRAKYGHKCFVCGKPQSKNTTKTGKVRKLSVHHVDMRKSQGCDSNWKLVPLCLHHHATAHNEELAARLGYVLKE